jgi:Spy/CpxP family protein refolding chaperone
MRNSLLKFALAASLILNVTVIATAGYRYYHQSHAWMTPLGRGTEKDRFLFEELSLTPAQLDAMKSKAVLFHREIDSRRLEIERKRKNLIALLRVERPDQRAIDAAINEINTRQEMMQKIVARHLLEIKTSLDRDQQRKFFDLIEGTMNKSGAPCMPEESAMQ